MSFEERLEWFFSESERVEKFLYAEKARRGISKSQLLFVGASDIASQHWCSMKAVFGARDGEAGRFGQYLLNRLKYAYRLGLISSWPNNLLETGEEITYEQVAELERKEPNREIDLEPSTEQIENYEKMSAIERGHAAEELYAERYPYHSWHFHWERYIVVCIPDGMTDDFIYEFKSTKKSKYLKNTLEGGSVQADIYGYFFKRLHKRVQAYSFDTRKIETSVGAVDNKNALRYLRNFLRVDSGEIPRPQPEYKCKSCEYAEYCPVRVGHKIVKQNANMEMNAVKSPAKWHVNSLGLSEHDGGGRDWWIESEDEPGEVIYFCGNDRTRPEAATIAEKIVTAHNTGNNEQLQRLIAKLSCAVDE
jgi:CRISPR/Cas system-associated exonuclease Cas4 (RecB family)